jgi:methyl coenzyme M reductase gamma subunit
MMPDTPLKKRQCTGQCRRELPETAEHFYFHPHTGAVAACCRECRNAQKLAKKLRNQGDDDLRGGVLETQRKVTTAFRRIDPGGCEETELRGRLRGIVKRFQGMEVGKKLKAMTWMLGEFLRPTEEVSE